MTQIKIEGGRYVGGVPHQKRQWEDFKKRDGRDFMEFDDPDHLYQAHADMLASEQEDRAKRRVLREYIHFWASDKRRVIQDHKSDGCYVRCDLCLLCRACKNLGGQRWRCMCDDGKKLLSPYRIVWLNASVKRHALTKVWSVGVGWVPRETEKYGQSARGLDS